MSSTRASRRRGAPKKYINDPFEAGDIKDKLLASSDSGSDTADNDEDVSDADVHVPQEEDDEEDDDLEMADAPDEEDDDPGTAPKEAIEASVNDDAESIVEVDSSDGESGPGSPGARPRKKRTTQRKHLNAAGSNSTVVPKHREDRQWGSAPKLVSKAPATSSVTANVQVVHARGIAEFPYGGPKDRRNQLLFGSEDQENYAKARRLWEQVYTFPTRDGGALRRSFFVGQEQMERNRRLTQEWYERSAREGFEKGQQSQVLSAEEARAYMPKESEELGVLMGPFKTPKKYGLKVGESISTAEPYEQKAGRRGWMLNLGGRIQDAQFAPCEEGKSQYVAVAVQQKNPHTKHNPMQSSNAPGFTAGAAFPTSFQIWAFDAAPDGSLLPKRKPRLELVICTDWGAVRQMKWSPEPVTKPGEGDQMMHLGLLALIFSDGKARILDISYPKFDQSGETHYLHITHSALTICMPYSIPTCFQWLSGTTLCIAAANGNVGVWDLTSSSTFTSSTPRPLLLKNLANTYIHTLATGYPSRPHMISTSSSDGHTRLTDLRAPLTDTVGENRRTRIFGISQAWHEQTQCFLTPDENYMLRSHAIRRYYMNIYSMRMDAQITSVSTSLCHPAVLVGCADGVVSCGNPIGRLFNAKEVPFQQVWFKHEWRRGVEGLSATTVAIPLSKTDPVVQKEALNKPLARILEGFRPEIVSLQRSGLGNGLTHTEDGKYLTIYEEPTGITCLAWNPNLKFGTWALAGMGDGLLRVEDVGVSW